MKAQENPGGASPACDRCQNQEFRRAASRLAGEMRVRLGCRVGLPGPPGAGKCPGFIPR